MLQDVSGRATGSKKCFKMPLAEPLGSRNASRCLWQSHLEHLWQSHLEQEMLQDVSGRALEQEMLQDVSGKATWSKKCFKMSLAEPLGTRNASRCLWQSHLEQEMLQDVSGRATWSKKCFMAEEQEMLQDVSGREPLGARNASRCHFTWSKKCFKMSLAESLGARNASRCL